MVIDLLYKNTLRKIKNSLGRYLSLLIIVLIGVGFFAGIQVTVPDMISVADRYYKEQNLMDFKVVSSLGLTDDDVKALSSLENAKTVIPSYSLDVLDHSRAIRLHALEDGVNNVRLIEGRMPETDTECVADSKNYAIGDVIKIEGNASDNLKSSEFTVVGTIDSVLYLADDYGSTTIGDGRLASFIFINRGDFTLDVYTEIYMIAKGTSSTTAYGTDYDAAAAKLENELIKIKPDREEARYQGILNSVQQKIGNAQARPDETGENIAGLGKPQWHIFGREAAVGYEELKSGIDVVSSVAAVFPLFFIAIVMLMTSNTMARMIAEERGELGTLTSLGYRDRSIITTYLLYVLSASGLGAVIGFYAGCSIIPPLISSNFRFILPPLVIQYDLITFALILLVTLALMTLVTIISCNVELRQQPAALMRPVPPKKGQKILLERIAFIWKHLSFTWKVTIRNMFRYKKRGIMTIIGVAGCASLLLVGFGLSDSMNGVAEKQYGEIFRYDNMIILNDEIKTIDGDLKSLLDKEKIKEPLLIRQASFQSGSGEKSQDTFLMVPENEAMFYNYFHLTDAKSGSTLELDDSGVVITRKLADTFSLNKGDILTLKDGENHEYQLTVSGVAENYTANYAYMSSALYNKVFGQAPAYNVVVSNHEGDEKELARQLMNSDAVLNVVFTDDLRQKILDSNESLDSIIVLIVVVASLLEIVVLYNLTSINISERTREIATLKVLGFNDGETNGYIYREAFILTLISTVLGMILGVFLHRFVVGIIEGNAMALFRKIDWDSFVWASVLTIAFSVIMQISTYFKLRKIDMIESLKSVE